MSYPAVLIPHRFVTARTLTTLIAVMLLVSCNQQAGTGELIRISGPTMGTTYSVKLRNLPSGLDPDSLQRQIERILERINGSMSTYLEDSELSRFNRQVSTDWIEVSSETLEVINAAMQTSKMTDGAFDITVGPLVNLWGFGPHRRDNGIPSEAHIRAALNKVGYDKIHTRTTAPAIRKDHPKTEVDLSAIAKGYAVDQITEHLEKTGVFDYLVEIGGELRAHGMNANGTPWTVGIEKPISSQKVLHKVVQLTDQAMATSGDYRNFFKYKGNRFSHTIHPRTGRPVEHQLASVTVIGPSSMIADALATGLNVMGPEIGFELAEREKIAALFIIREGDSFRTRATAAFAEVISQ
ncbi:MAG: FAD:protein FMN transferase ApbE [Deltaproteobacteria bacterium]|nr:FAD:protein FMN transferase ApbE [Deltaproteobacteria bacterium]